MTFIQKSEENNLIEVRQKSSFKLKLIENNWDDLFV